MQIESLKAFTKSFVYIITMLYSTSRKSKCEKLIPSRHHFGIFFPITGRKPCLVWIDSCKDSEEPRQAPYKHNEIDHLMYILGNDSYIGHALLDIHSNYI
jgi:hypothetical protein